MSRIGSEPIQIPSGVTATIDGDVIVRGPKGEYAVPLPQQVTVAREADTLIVSRKGHGGDVSAIHGLTRAMLANAVIGVTVGWTKKLELSGVGYRASMVGNAVELIVGFSHPVNVTAPQGVTISVVEGKIVVHGVNRHLVGQTAADIRAVKPPEPYKGKGITYEGEIIRRKPGKAAKAVGGAPSATGAK